LGTGLIAFCLIKLSFTATDALFNACFVFPGDARLFFRTFYWRRLLQGTFASQQQFLLPCLLQKRLLLLPLITWQIHRD